MSDPHYVKRTRIRDRSAAHEMGGQSKVGNIGYSKTFPTKKAAEREAAAWNSDGDWEAIVINGKAPTDRSLFHRANQ